MREERPVISMSSKAYQKMLLYPQKSPHSEVWGILIGDIRGSRIRVDDIKIFSHAISSTGLTRPNYMERDKWMIDNPDIIGDHFERNIGWYHTHCGIPPLPSPIDYNTMRAIGGSYLVTIISSSTGEYYAQIDIKNPIKMTIEDVEIVPEMEFSDSIVAEVMDNIENRVMSLKSNDPVEIVNPDTPAVEQPGDNDVINNLEKQFKYDSIAGEDL